MQSWFLPVLALCAVVLTTALVWAIWTLVLAGRRVERVLALMERELERDVPPLLTGLKDLTGELRLLSAGANAELDRIGQITERVQELSDASARLLTALAGLTRVGQVVGIAAGLKTGVDVFIDRWRKPRGEDGHE